MIKLISFDIGGTLVDIKEKSNFYIEMKSVLGARNINYDTAIKELKLNNYTIEKYCNYIGIDCPEKICEIISKSRIKHVLYDDVIDSLSILKKKYKLITISNAISIKNVFLKEYNISDYFTLELYSYDYHSLKPDSKMFEYAMKKLGVKSEECMHIGDNKNDVLGAQKAGWISVYLNRNGCSLPSWVLPDYSINSLNEVIQISSMI